MTVSAEEYERIALDDPKGFWELHDGCLVQKPSMTYEHNRAMDRLAGRLRRQLDEDEFEIRTNAGRTRRVDTSYFIPDVFVIPAALGSRMAERSRTAPTPPLEVYAEPVPLVVEIWSRSTGQYDVDTKIPEYKRRGDLEIWRIHPYERTLIAWRSQPDGSYTETHYTGGPIQPVALPGVTIIIDELFG
ncbi:MAG: Uma2 family endonuclease [Chloroflexi bacterium]|nr:Uma2 family endonuclease [Chloroflexota bacterium]